jgi:hypothetical protein
MRGYGSKGTQNAIGVKKRPIYEEKRGIESQKKKILTMGGDRG